MNCFAVHPTDWEVVVEQFNGDYFYSHRLSLAVYSTVLFACSLNDKKRSFRAKLWEWIKNVFDALSF